MYKKYNNFNKQNFSWLSCSILEIKQKPFIIQIQYLIGKLKKKNALIAKELITSNTGMWYTP